MESVQEESRAFLAWPYQQRHHCASCVDMVLLDRGAMSIAFPHFGADRRGDVMARRNSGPALGPVGPHLFS